MEVHGQHAVGAGAGDHVGHQLGGDGITAFGLAVLTGVAEVGHHGGDPACGSAAAGVDGHQQFHQVVVDRLTGGLDDEHIAAADGLVEGDGDFAIGKGRDGAFAQGHAQSAADALRKGTVGVGGEHLYFFTMCDHLYCTSLHVLWFFIL